MLVAVVVVVVHVAGGVWEEKKKSIGPQGSDYNTVGTVGVCFATGKALQYLCPRGLGPGGVGVCRQRKGWGQRRGGIWRPSEIVSTLSRN